MKAKRPCTGCGRALRKSNLTGYCQACLPPPTSDHMRELVGLKHQRDRANAQLAERWRTEHGEES